MTTKTTTPAPSVRAYLAEIGRRGGKAGTGAAKRRTRKQAQTAANTRWTGSGKASKLEGPKDAPG